ncbi:hypothetical protein D9758_001708 [Tetrapyrgos nigripes]|uniref:Uncharacterized protein n=1 Tax=Tetrapyrgos nigripes TaxID=182062 RepID=A0A8H5LX86_9AGAR|nr:hypothetical protein D9758_001708 [Tetrapyrgos nigripes]
MTLLSNKLSEELKYETQAIEGGPIVPEFSQIFKKQGVWEKENVPYHNEILLTRNLRLIVDIRTELEEERQDSAAEEDDDPGQEALNIYPIRPSLSITKMGPWRRDRLNPTHHNLPML